ncbi:MAG: zf-TFIIB domain-containing protein [Pseudomonadota bacterium]
MKCPTCKDVNLAISDRQGIEIDYCPECRGVWLDRGELDKIIERSGSLLTQQKYNEKESEKYGHGPHGYSQKDKKRKSFLGELLDF